MAQNIPPSGHAPTLDHRRGPRCAAPGVRCTSRGTIRAVSAFATGSWFSTWEQDMRSLLASGCVAIMLLSAAPSYAQLDVGSGLVGAGVGAAIGGVAGRWPRRRNGGHRRRLGRRCDRRVQPAPELRLPLPRLCRAWRLPLDTGALQPVGRMAAGLLRAILEGCFRGRAVVCNSPKSAPIAIPVYGVRHRRDNSLLWRVFTHAEDPVGRLDFVSGVPAGDERAR